MVSVMVSFVLSFFPRDVLDEILNLIESVSEDFPSYFWRRNRVSNHFLHEYASWFNWWISFAPEFQCDYFCESSCLFYLSFNSDFYVSKIMHL